MRVAHARQAVQAFNQIAVVQVTLNVVLPQQQQSQQPHQQPLQRYFIVLVAITTKTMHASRLIALTMVHSA